MTTLKGQCHEIFCFWFFSWISFPRAPEYSIKIVSNFRKHSNNPNVIIRGLGEGDSWKKPEAKISWHCPFKWIRPEPISAKNNNYYLIPDQSIYFCTSLDAFGPHVFSKACPLPIDQPRTVCRLENAMWPHMVRKNPRRKIVFCNLLCSKAKSMARFAFEKKHIAICLTFWCGFLSLLTTTSILVPVL